MDKNTKKTRLPAGHFLFTSESVSQGHPDKLCDYISDSVLDACLTIDSHAKVACETAVKNSICMVFGEITLNGQLSYEQIVREAIKEIGYDSMEKGFDHKLATVIVAIDQQSQEIADSVHINKNDEELGAGDQGLMIGYATNETPEFMPLSHAICNRLIERLTDVRKNGTCSWMYPDAKVQVTIEYKQDGSVLTPVRVHNILISQQHTEKIQLADIQKDLFEHVIKVVVPSQYLDDSTIYHLNPSKSFIMGGPCGDAGLTGRKIIVDTYGGWGGHGGGAFSGKDPTKVDRSAAYAARWVAKSLVASRLCSRAFVQVAYGIGLAEPLSVYVNSYGSVIPELSDYDLQRIVEDNFDLRPGMIIKELNLRRPIYRKTSHHGHFGRNDPDFTWETPKIINYQEWRSNKSD